MHVEDISFSDGVNPDCSLNERLHVCINMFTKTMDIYGE